MRGSIWIGLALVFTACRQTVVFDQSGSDGSVGVDAASDGLQPPCTGAPTPIVPEYPEVVIALDRSAGMTGRFGDTTQLAAARDAVYYQAGHYQKAIHFGYVDFPGSSTSSCPQGGCCAGRFFSPNPNFLVFDNALHSCDATQSCASSSSTRPTWAALTSTLGWVMQPPANRRYVLLITNGEPDCGAQSIGDCQDTNNVVSQIAGMSIKTHVVVPAQGSLDNYVASCMAMLALAGNTSTPQPYYHWATDPADLKSELDNVIGDIATDACQVDLPQAQTPVDPDRGAVWWNNTPIPRSHNGSEGWDLANNGFDVKLRGQWCDKLIQDGPDAFAVYPICSPRH